MIYISFYGPEGGTPVDREVIGLADLIRRTEELLRTHTRYELHDGSQAFVCRTSRLLITMHVQQETP